jgi:hypothetical protein
MQIVDQGSQGTLGETLVALALALLVAAGPSDRSRL